jgi:prevent-host-death family protein
MTTITSLDLRKNLDSIVTRVRAGESIRVTYRSKPAFVLQPEVSISNEPEPGSIAAMHAAMNMIREIDKVPRTSSLDPHKSFKDLYHEALDTDPKYQGRYE